MLTAIIAGQRDPRVLAQMARTRMRAKIAQPEQALDCSFFTGQHAFILAMMLASIDHLTAQAQVPDAKIPACASPMSGRSPSWTPSPAPPPPPPGTSSPRSAPA